MPKEFSRSELTTGNPTIDDLHRDFLNALDYLTSVSDDGFKLQFEIFVQSAEKTFGIEEAWMEEMDCAITQSHREQHARVLGALHNVHARLMEGDITLGRDVVERLFPQWFALHTSTMDVALGAALEFIGAEVTIIDKTNDLALAHNA